MWNKLLVQKCVDFLGWHFPHFHNSHLLLLTELVITFHNTSSFQIPRESVTLLLLIFYDFLVAQIPSESEAWLQ
jgi:hypothetical protein